MRLIDYLCSTEVCNCTEKELLQLLRQPFYRFLVEESLQNQKLYTLHNINQEIQFRGLSVTHAANTFAYNGYLGITVQQHFFSRQRIRLQYPKLPMVIHLSNNRPYYYPIETLGIDIETYV